MNTLKTLILLSCTVSLCLAVSISEQLSTGGFTRMSSLLNDSGLNDTLKGKGPFTIFVPNNQAFQNASLPTDKQQLTTVIKNHIVEGNLTSKSIAGGWKSLGGATLNITKSANGTFLINNATKITKPDIFIDNGVIHEVDSIILASGGNQTEPATPSSGNASNAAT